MALSRSLILGNTVDYGGEVSNDGTITANNHNLFGHKGLTNAEAFQGFTPSGSAITATSDGGAGATMPVPTSEGYADGVFSLRQRGRGSLGHSLRG